MNDTSDGAGCSPASSSSRRGHECCSSIHAIAAIIAMHKGSIAREPSSIATIDPGGANPCDHSSKLGAPNAIARSTTSRLASSFPRLALLRNASSAIATRRPDPTPSSRANDAPPAVSSTRAWSPADFAAGLNRNKPAIESLRAPRASGPEITLESPPAEVSRTTPSRFQSLSGAPKITAVPPARIHRTTSLASASASLFSGARKPGATNHRARFES